MDFSSDNEAPACREIVDAMLEANMASNRSYGADEWTTALDSAFGDFFETEVRVFPVATGTAANSLALGAIVPPYGAIYAHEQAHLYRDECGAPEFFCGGARVVPVQGPAAKLSSDGLESAISSIVPSYHSLMPAAISLTQATEYGTVYRPKEISDLSAVARGHGMKVHMDGARFANAIVFLGLRPADLTWKAGVDVLSFGATKNGAIAAEAVVFFDRSLAGDFDFRRKRSGHLVSKMRYISVQLLRYLDTGIWHSNAARANGLARRIATCSGDLLEYPVEANEVFLRLSAAQKQCLRSTGFRFEDWGAAKSDQVRFVVSWNQSEVDVKLLCDALINFFPSR